MNFRLIKFGIPLLLGIAVLIYGMLYRIRHAPPTEPSRPELVIAPEVVIVSPPVSVRELLHNLSEYRGPIGAGSFKGYTNLQSVEPLKIKLNWNESGPSLEWHVRGGAIKVWQSKDLALFQFKKDPQSLVLRLPNRSLVYLKYETAKTLTAYPQSLNVFTGWHVMDRRVSKVVMIEDLQTGWPRVDSLTDVWPGDLPY